MESDPENGGRIGVASHRRLAAGLLVLAGWALAQPATAATPAEIAAAKARADQVIAAAHAGDVFVNTTTDAVPQVRHLKSGLVCGFDLDDAKANITIYDSDKKTPRGDDVSCSNSMAEALITTYATRYPSPMTAQQVLKESADAIRQQFTDVKRWTGDGVTMTEQAKAGGPKPVEATTLRLSATLKGKPVFTRSSAASCGPWIIAQRATVAPEKAMVADLAAELELRHAIEAVCSGVR
jgi:hypothetical protein